MRVLAGRFRLALLCALTTMAAAALTVQPAAAQPHLQSLFEADPNLKTDPAGTLAQLRLLGVQRVRLLVIWAQIAPRPNAQRAPSGFDAADPASYPDANWAIWDTIVSDAAANGIGVDFDVMQPAPRWALGRGEPRNGPASWEPSASMYQAFVHALGVRYSGDYDPVAKQLSPGDPADLPAVSFWSIWNEPNYGPSLSPQGVPGNLKIPASPRMYRPLVQAAWTALHQTGHGADTILFGELAPRGASTWGVFSGMKPLIFLRELYCVDSHYRQYRGRAAAVRGCPTTAGASRRFRAANPGLFRASGFADHPYMRWYSPNREQNPDPNYASLGEIGNLEHTLDHVQRVYGSHTQLPIWDTEYGYLTDPPKRPVEPNGQHVSWVSPQTAAYYLNWAEYISWRDPRIQSFDQYLLSDPERPTRGNGWGGFASGLLTFKGSPKADYDAWRLPLFLPRIKASSGQNLEVWGCVRPAPYATLDTGQPQTAELQFDPASDSGFQTVQAITVGSDCYFDLPVAFPGSGTVRLAYTYPQLDLSLGNFGDPETVYSRPVTITLR